MFEIRVTHPVTKEVLEFLGQGGTVSAALADGAKVINETFRPSTSGPRHPPSKLKVVSPDGTVLLRTLKEFENGPAPTMDLPQ